MSRGGKGENDNDRDEDGERGVSCGIVLFFFVSTLDKFTNQVSGQF